MCTLHILQDFMAGGGKGGLWKAQRVPFEPWHMGQYGYNQVEVPSACILLDSTWKIWRPETQSPLRF